MMPRNTRFQSQVTEALGELVSNGRLTISGDNEVTRASTEDVTLSFYWDIGQVQCFWRPADGSAKNRMIEEIARERGIELAGYPELTETGGTITRLVAYGKLLQENADSLLELNPDRRPRGTQRSD